MLSWPFVVWIATGWFRNSVYPSFSSPAELGEVVSLWWLDPFREILSSSNFHPPQPLLPTVVFGFIETKSVFEALGVAKRGRAQASWPQCGLWLVSTRGCRPAFGCDWLPSFEEWSAWSCPGHSADEGHWSITPAVYPLSTVKAPRSMASHPCWPSAASLLLVFPNPWGMPAFLSCFQPGSLNVSGPWLKCRLAGWQQEPCLWFCSWSL